MSRKQLNIRLPEAHIARLDAMREAEGLSQSEMVMRLIDERWVIEQLEAHLERLWLRKLEGETRFGEARPVVVYDGDNEPTF